MSLKTEGRIGTLCAAVHFERSIERPVPYRCTTATKMSAVAAAIRAAINHSSKWSSVRLSTPSKRISPLRPKRPGVRSLSTVFPVVVQQPSVHFDVEFLGNQVEDLLPNASLGPCVGWTHCRLPSLALIVGQVMQCGLARLLDLRQGILIFLDRDRIGIVRRLV